MDLNVEKSTKNNGNINILNSQKVSTINITVMGKSSKIIYSTKTTNNEANNDFKIISRNQWMAEPPRQKTNLPNIAKYVVISHTATEEAFTDSENNLLVKLVQSFHMDSRKWDDIAYNFLVGSNGKVYEGRGWNIVGAHTYGYNNKSVGISFIGCFMDHLPTQQALNAAKALINFGVNMNYITRDYSLVGHCQCSPVESPGYQLYMEIKTWPNWRELNSSDAELL